MSKHSLDRFLLSRKLLSEEDNLYKIAAKSYLQYFGNNNPTKKQLSEMQALLFNVWLRRTIVFDTRLTNSEKQCLYHAAQGKSAKETAHILQVTVRTVEFHRQAILAKLSCKNMTQAVSIGIGYAVTI